MANNFFKTRNGVSIGSLAAAPSAPVNGDVYYDTTLKKFQKYENGVWGALGGGGSGSGKNYLTAYTASTSSGVPNTGNGDLEFGSTSGFGLGHVTLTSNFPSGVPTFGSGASGNLSLSAISSSQLAGLYSLGYISSAATTAGDFVATDAFFVDKEDQAKMMTFSFAYNAFANPTNGNFSGTSSNSFAVAIYDVTNSVWIQPAGVFNLVQSAGVGICSGTFQTSSNSTQYRLVVYNANATSGAISMYFDDFICGPQTIQKGPAMSDWVAYTPTLGAGYGTATNNTAYYRRVGDAIEVYGSFTTGTVAGSSSAIGLPAGLAIDSAKVSISNTTSNPGQDVGRLRGQATNNYMTLVSATATSTTSVFMSGLESNNTSLTPVNANAVLSSTTFATYHFTVPILGWSSNSVVSSDTDTRVVAAGATASSASTATNAPIIFPTVLFDTHAAYDSSTGRYTCPVAGYYRIEGNAQTNNGTPVFQAYKNGSLYSNIGVAGGAFGGTFCGVVKANAGDIIDVRPNSGTGAGAPAAVSFTRESGPAVVAVSESINCKYYLSANSTPGASLPINFDTKLWDTHNAVTTGASWKFTAPVSGKYHVDLVLAKAGATASDMNVYKNGSSDCAIAYYPTGTDYQTGSTVVSMNAGDTIDIRGSGNSTYGGSASVNTHVSIFRIGN